MPRLRNWIVLTLVLLCQITASSAPARSQRPGRQLIQRLKALADAGRLTDPAFVARTLGMTFTSRSESQAPYARNCAPGLVKRDSVNTFYTPTPGSALQPTPFGRDSITRAGFGTVNAQPATVSGQTVLTYFITQDHDCSGYVRTSNNVTADLSIGPVSTYDCISMGELRGWLPQAQDAYATDGAIVAYYTGRNGTTITFTFFVGTPCLLSISMGQDPTDTPRYQAAAESQKTCMLPHEAQFCASHAPFGWEAGDVQDDMASFAVAKCGTIDSFLKRAPASAKPSSSMDQPIEVQPDRSTPCSAVRSTIDRLKRSRSGAASPRH